MSAMGQLETFRDATGDVRSRGDAGLTRMEAGTAAGSSVSAGLSLCAGVAGRVQPEADSVQ